MTMSQQIEAVYQRALRLRQHALESPVHQNLVEKSLHDLYLVLEELQTAQDELHQQHHELLATRQAVESERQRYQTLFDFAPNGYIVTDRKGIIHQVNRAAVALLCTSQATLINKPLLVFIHESDRSWFQMQLANLTLERTWEVRLHPHHHEPVLVAIAITRIKDAQRRDVLLWSLNDITLSKRMERQIQGSL